MDDFKSQLSACIDELLAKGTQPVFLVVEMEGIEALKQHSSEESLRRFQREAIDSIVWTAGAVSAFTYDERIVVAIIPGFDRLKTFACIQRLRRGLPLLAQSYDCPLQPSFDVLEYDEAQGVGGLIKQLVGRDAEHRRAA